MLLPLPLLLSEPSVSLAMRVPSGHALQPREAAMRVLWRVKCFSSFTIEISMVFSAVCLCGAVFGGIDAHTATKQLLVSRRLEKNARTLALPITVKYYSVLAEGEGAIDRSTAADNFVTGLLRSRPRLLCNALTRLLTATKNCCGQSQRGWLSLFNASYSSGCFVASDWRVGWLFMKGKGRFDIFSFQCIIEIFSTIHLARSAYNIEMLRE